MSQQDGRFVVQVLVTQHVPGELLAMLQIKLGGIETEGEKLPGDVHLQFIAAERILRGAGQLAQGLHLVQLPGHVHVAGTGIAVQLQQELLRPPVGAGRPGACRRPKGDRQPDTYATKETHAGIIG